MIGPDDFSGEDYPSSDSFTVSKVEPAPPGPAKGTKRWWFRCVCGNAWSEDVLIYDAWFTVPRCTCTCGEVVKGGM